MQKEKRNILIVVIVVVVVLALVGLFFLIHGINIKKNKKESWYNYDTAVVSILVEGSNEGVIEIPLKEITDSNAEIITRIVFTDPGQYESLPPKIEIKNDGIVIYELNYGQALKKKSIVRKTDENISGPDENGKMCSQTSYRLYRHADDDSLEFFKAFEIYVYANEKEN